MAGILGRAGRVLTLTLALATTGCFSAASFMSVLNEGLGSECYSYLVEWQVWAADEGKWVDGLYAVDERWVNAQADYYLSLYRFSVWENTAPSGNQYRFATSCAGYY